MNYTSSRLVTTNGSSNIFYAPQPEPISKHKPYCRMWITGILKESKHLVTVPYLLRAGMDAPVRIGRIFGQIYKTDWEWFR